MNDYVERTLIFLVHIVAKFALLLIASVFVSLYQSHHFSGVLMHVIIGGLGPLIVISEPLYAPTFMVALLSYQILQSYQFGTNNDGNILQYIVGFVVVATADVIVEYIAPRYSLKTGYYRGKNVPYLPMQRPIHFSNKGI